MENTKRRIPRPRTFFTAAIVMGVVGLLGSITTSSIGAAQDAERHQYETRASEIVSAFYDEQTDTRDAELRSYAINYAIGAALNPERVYSSYALGYDGPWDIHELVMWKLDPAIATGAISQKDATTTAEYAEEYFTYVTEGAA